MSEPLGPPSPGKVATSHFVVSDSVSISTQTRSSITVPRDFRPLARLCRLGKNPRFLRVLAILRSCAWRIRTDRYKLHGWPPGNTPNGSSSPPHAVFPHRLTRPRNRACRRARSRCETKPLLASWSTTKNLSQQSRPNRTTRSRASQSCRHRFDFPACSRMPLWHRPPSIC